LSSQEAVAVVMVDRLGSALVVEVVAVLVDTAQVLHLKTQAVERVPSPNFLFL